MRTYQLSCESTVDIPYSEIVKRDIKVLFYHYELEGKSIEDDMGRNESFMIKFYDDINKGLIPSTSQLNEYDYYHFFKEILDSGKDVFHITLGTGMTQSYNNALAAKEELARKYPDRNIIIIDSLCSSIGYGMLVLKIKEKIDNGENIEEIINWTNINRTHVHHQFFSTDLKYFRRTGRVSGCAACLSSMLKICPIMKLNKEGKIIAYNKVFGKGMAIKRTVDNMEKHCTNGINYNDKCFICHSNCLDSANEIKDLIERHFVNLKDKVIIYDIGPIIASHCGPGTVAVFFFGDERI